MGISGDTAPAPWTRADVRWRVPLPEPGNSTPVVSGNRVFVTQALKAEGRRMVMCFDRASGKLLWQSGVNYSDPEPTHPTNPYASASPVTDGKLVIAWFGSAGVVAYDFSGKELWRRDLGIQRHTWGYGSSPVLHGDLVFLNFGPGARAFVIALDKRSGKTVWQYDIPAGNGMAFSNWSAADMYGSWATPVVIRAGGRAEVVLSLPRRVVALDPKSGRVLWNAAGMGDLVYPSVVSGDGIIAAIGGFGGPSVAVRAAGNGDVTESMRIWRREKSRPMIGSGVIHEGHIYTVDNGGIAECTELKTGKTVWTGRLRGAGDSQAVWSSPVLANGKLLVMNQSGEVFVFKAGPQFEVLGSSSVGEPTNSSIVLSDGDLFLRTHMALWRISAGK